MDSVDVQAGKRIAPWDSTSDIISNLPSHIIDNILICLPILDAAKTSSLSKTWRFKWLYMPQLMFNNLNVFGGNVRNNRYHSTSGSKSQKIWSRIKEILLLHRGPVHKFLLFVPFEVETERDSINKIILFLAGRDIREFTLRVMLKPQYRLPSTLFHYCKQLTHLNLSNCDITLPPEFIGLSRLISLELSLVNILANHLKAFISKCPLLQILVLQLATIDDNQTLEIDAPSLKLLNFDWPSTSVIFKNVPILSTVKIINCGVRRRQTSDTFNVFHSLPASTEYLLADATFLLHLAVDVIQDRLPIMPTLKSVELPRWRCSSMKEIQSTILLIRSSPNLQKLKLKVFVEEKKVIVDGDTTTPILEFCKALSLVEDPYNQLEEVMIEDFNGTMIELEFLKFILANSLVLKRISIRPPQKFKTEDRLRILTAASRFQRASTKAELMYS